MMHDRTGIKWSEEETTLALYLYYLIEGKQIGNRSGAIKDLAAFLGRTPASVEMKIGNLQFFDDKNSKGLKNGGKTDEIIFKRYLYNPDLLDITAKEIIDSNRPEAYLIPELVKANPYEEIIDTDLNVMMDYSGSESYRMRKERNEQDSFRNRLFANYECRCCLSEVCTPQLLIASHIVPWSKDETKRVDPKNGILLNAYLDKAFDKGIITIEADDFTVCISDKLKDESALDYLNQYRGKQILLPRNKKVWPEKENLQYHNDVIFGKYDSSMIDFPSFEQFKQHLVV